MKTLGMIATMLVLSAFASADITVDPADVSVDQSIGTFQVLIPITFTDAVVVTTADINLDITPADGGLEFARGNSGVPLNDAQASHQDLGGTPNYLFHTGAGATQQQNFSSGTDEFAVSINDTSFSLSGDLVPAGTWDFTLLNLVIPDPTIANGGPVTYNIDITLVRIEDEFVDPLPVQTSGLQVTITPEPATMALLGIGGIGLLLRRKKRSA